jgi:hypothetical protein
MMALISSLASIAYKIQINSWDIEKLQSTQKIISYANFFQNILVYNYVGSTTKPISMNIITYY